MASVKSNSFEHTKQLFAETNRQDDHAWHCNLGSLLLKRKIFYDHLGLVMYINQSCSVFPLNDK